MPNPNLPINARYNTYIGARYVPKFADPTEWSNQQTYEPLMIVTYQGNSYTSKTFVPVGVDILNTTYWAETGSYNAQVEQYRQETLLNTREIELLALKQKHFILLGDSYSTGDYGGNCFEAFTDCPLFTADNMEQLAENGIGFATTSGIGHNWLQLLQTSTMPKNSVTDIIVIGGYNDYNKSYANIVSAINNFMTYVDINYPNALVSVILCGTSYSTVQTRLNLYNTVRPAYSAPGNVNYRYLTGCEYALHSKIDFDSTEFHPSSHGYDILKTRIINAYLGGKSAFRAQTSVGGTLVSGVTLDLNQIFVNAEELVTIYCYDLLTLKINPAITVNSSTQSIQLATGLGNLYNGNCKAAIYITTFTNTYMAYMLFSGENLNLVFRDNNISSSKSFELSECYISPFNVTVPYSNI